MPDTALPTDLIRLVPPSPAPVARDDHRTAASLGFLLRYLMRSKAPLSNHHAVVERLRAELVWSTSEWKRLNPSWNGWHHEAEAYVAALPSPEKQRLQEFLTSLDETIQLGKKADVDVETINPMLEVFKRISKSALTYQPAES